MISVTVDLDGVCADFSGHVQALYNVWFDADVDFSSDSRREMWQMLPEFNSKSDFWRWVDSIDNFWETMPVIPGAPGGIWRLDMSPNIAVSFLTSRKGSKAYERTLDWLNRTMPILGDSRLHSNVKGADKVLHAGHIHVDDTLHVIEPMLGKDTVHVIVFDQPWNRSLDVGLYDNATRVKNWSEVLEVVSTFTFV